MMADVCNDAHIIPAEHQKECIDTGRMGGGEARSALLHLTNSYILVYYVHYALFGLLLFATKRFKNIST